MTASKTAQTIRTAAPAAPVRAPAQPQMAPPMVARHALGARELARFAAGVSRDRTASAQAVRLVSRLPGRGAGMMLACQRAYGNAHVQRMIAGREHEDRAPRDRAGRPRPSTEVRAGTDEHQITHLSADRNAGTVEERRSPAAQTFRVSSPQDAAEKEAVNVARQVMRAPAPAATPGADEKTVHRAAAGPPQMSANTAAAIQSDLGAGTPLPREVRRFMEPRFRADFSRVKIHTGDRSAQLSRDLNAHAFTVNNHVFFGKDRYQPATDAGKELIAHELTHTIQQGGAAQRQAAETPVTESAGLQVQRDFSDDALAYVRDHLNVIPGFRMLTIILGSNPVTHEKVDASAANILRALIEFLPGGALISEALANAGVFDRAGTFVEAQVRTLGLAAGSLWNALMTLVHSVGIGDALDPGAVWNRAQRIFTEPIDRIIAFAKGLVSGIVTIIKDAILRPIAELAKGTAGYDLLKAVLGHDPITGDEVPQTAENILEPFMRLIGQEEIWENMKKAHAIPRAFAWFKGALAGVMGFVAAVPGRFKAAFLSLELADIVLVPRAFAKIAGAFAGLVGQFMSWAGGTIWNLLEIVFDSVSPGALAYVKKTGSALKGILQNPMPFVGNLAKAAKLGFLNFAGNIVGHLKSGLVDWLTGSLPGVYIPKAFELGEVAKFAFSVLGLTWANIRQKLVKAVGEPAVKAMETGFDIVVTLVRDGPAAAWDKIKEQLGNLKDMVIGGITDFVVDAIVKKAVPKLVAMFIPGAGFISAIVSIYDMVMTFVNRLKQIGQVVMAFVDSIVAIAAGTISPAAARIESTLAGLLSLAISFFAGFVGLGNVAEKIRGVIEKIRAPIDKALDWLIGWIVTTAKKLFAKAFGSEKTTADPGKQLHWDEGIKAVRALVSRIRLHPISKEQIGQELGTIKANYGFKTLNLQATDSKFHIHAEMNPVEDIDFEESDAHPEEFTDESLWENQARRVNAEEKLAGTGGSKLSDKSYEWNKQVLLALIDQSNEPEAQKAKARDSVLSNLMAAKAATQETVVYSRMRAAGGAVNKLYAAEIAVYPGMSLQAHHRPGVKESVATFWMTRAQRKRSSIAARIKNNAKNLSAEETALSLHPLPDRRALIAEYVQQQLELEIEDALREGAGPLEEFDLDVLTRDAHLKDVHGQK